MKDGRSDGLVVAWVTVTRLDDGPPEATITSGDTGEGRRVLMTTELLAEYDIALASRADDPMRWATIQQRLWLTNDHGIPTEDGRTFDDLSPFMKATALAHIVNGDDVVVSASGFQVSYGPNRANVDGPGWIGALAVQDDDEDDDEDDAEIAEGP